MATFNLIRNSRVFFTTNFSTTNASAYKVSAGSGGAEPVFALANTQELQVLDGFSFSQASNADTVTIAEAGATPTRGQRSFNTSLGTVEFSFSTYIRPRYASNLIEAEESHLWNALLSSTPVLAAQTSVFVATTISAVTCAINTGALSITGTGITGVAVGDILVIKGVGKTTGAVGSSQFNTPVKVLTVSSTVVTAQYIVAPTVACPAIGSWIQTDIAMTKTAWNKNVAVAADTAGPAYANAGAAYSTITTAMSNKNQLLPFGMIITVDGVTYVIDNCALDQAVVDFGLDGIATVAWTGKGTALRQLATNVTYTTATDPVMSGGLIGTATGKTTTANFITNKLSTVTLTKNIGGIGAGNTSYTLALTGGSLTIANGINYVTPANLGVVNVPIGYYTGTRAISGSMTAYLRTGSTNSSGLLADLLAASSGAGGIEPKFFLQIAIGGSASETRIELEMSGCNLQIPTIDAQAVMSTSINFTAQGSDSIQGATAGYDLEATNDLVVRYLSA